MSLNSFRHGMGNLASSPAGKWTMFAVGGVLVFSLVYSGLGNNLGGAGAGGARAAGPTGADTVATVNGAPVPRAQFEQTVASLKQQSQMMGGRTIGVSEMPMLNNDALNQVTTAQLALQRAEKMGFTASDTEIAQARQQAIQQSGIAGQLGLPTSASATDINNALAKANSPSLDQVFPDDNLKNSIIMQKLQASFAQPVTEQDARDFYKEYHTRHILIDNKKVSDVQAQSKAQQILAKALAPGADFAALARQYSDDPGTKPKGGDDGWIGEDNNFNGYIPEFTKAATALKPGEITPSPIKTPEFGYFLIQLVAVRDNLPKDFDKNQAKYIDQVRQQRQQAAQQAFLTQINGDPSNKIVVTDPALRGEQELAKSQQGDPTQRPAKLNAAVTDLTGALKGASFGETGEIQAALAQAYQGLNKPQQALAAMKAAVDATHDQNLEMALGQMYVQNKDPQDAVAQFQAASTQAWNDPSVHQNLEFTYKSMKRPDLAAKEHALYQQIQKRQAQTGNSPLGGLSLAPPAETGAQPAVQTGAQPAVQTGAVTVKPAAGQPAPPAPKPGQ